MKRSAAEGALVSLQEEKKRREGAGEVVVGGVTGSKMGQVVRARTSELEAPVMLLTGHQSEVLCLEFSPQGNTLASAGADRMIYIWNVYGQCPNLHRFKGHTNAILQLKYNDTGSQIYTASADSTVCIWDVESQTRVKKIQHTKEIVNTCSTSRTGAPLLLAGGDDGFGRLYDTRTPKHAAQEYEGAFPVTACALSESGDKAYLGDTSGEIQVWESRKQQVLYTLAGHLDIVTGLEVRQDFLLSNSADNSLRMWDTRPFVAGGDTARCAKVFSGHQHGADKNLLRCAWHPEGTFVSAGSSDNPPTHFIWRASTRKVEYQLPGHKAGINDVAFHPGGQIFGSASSDNKIYLGEMMD
eukprot:TRINITY_DN14698_c0_g1_i1.p1 TRINITY_DN14698_c0_g1~~TRINITY_DN14698_c0_g1_i1.p1  ORF type:complete len:368 (+),score=75.36 TRINITY_DN14698_c0_g1_i1:40-1104(+)